MSDKEQLEIVEGEADLQETAAAETLKPGSQGGSKAEMLATFTSLMAQLGKEDLSNFLNDAIALIGKEADPIPSGTSAKNAASIATKGAVKEDVAEMLNGEELTEEFKEKAAIIFEAAVESRIILETTRLEEEYEEKLETEIEAIRDDLTEKVDQYLDYVVEQWLESNQIAIEQSLRSEIAEDFMEKLRNLFVESNINVPEEKIDVLGEMNTRIEELESKLNEQINKNIELQSVVSEAEKYAAFDEVSEGLAATQIEKFRTLSEGVDFTSVESYRKKLEVIKEQYFSTRKQTSTNIITEEVEETEPQAVPVPAHMAKYVSAISRTVK